MKDNDLVCLRFECQSTGATIQEIGMQHVSAKSSAKCAVVIIATVLLSISAADHIAFAAEPELKTPAPVIYLADNLDEKDNLGWCIDTVGRGLSDRLHAHSCKPRGGDVQFKFANPSGQIQSATFEGKCAQLLQPAADGVKLGLLACGGDGQSFTYDVDSGELHPAADKGLCLVVAASSRSAGPFMSRDLQLSSCSATEEKYKRWIVKAGN